MSVQQLPFSEPFYTMKFIDGESRYEIDDISIVINLGESDIRVKGSPLGYLKSTIVKNVTLTDVRRAIVVEGYASRMPAGELFAATQKQWPLMYETTGLERFKGTGNKVAIVAGTLLGAILGSEVGRSLDKADQAHASRTTQSSLESAPTGKPSRWVNPDSGHSGSVTPTRTFKSSSGEDCREFEQTVTIDGRTEVAYGTACRQPDGTWKIVDA